MPSKEKAPAISCKECAHFSMDGALGSQSIFGFCRRYPPAPLPSNPQSYVFFPVVRATDRCGEFKKKGSRR